VNKAVCYIREIHRIRVRREQDVWSPIPKIGKQGWGLMKTDFRIQSEVEW